MTSAAASAKPDAVLVVAAGKYCTLRGDRAPNWARWCVREGSDRGRFSTACSRQKEAPRRLDVEQSECDLVSRVAPLGAQFCAGPLSIDANQIAEDTTARPWPPRAAWGAKGEFHFSAVVANQA